MAVYNKHDYIKGQEEGYELYWQKINEAIANLKSSGDNYLEKRRLNTRYKMHKLDVLELVLQRKRYTDTKIKQLSKLLGGSKSIIKITGSFVGHEIFESNLSKKPKKTSARYSQDNQAYLKLTRAC